MDDDSTMPDPVVDRLMATLRAHADTVEAAPSAYASLRHDIRRARRRTLAACAAGVATIAVAGGVVFTSYGAPLGEPAPASDPRAPWSDCATKDGWSGPIGGARARLARAIDDYGPAEGRDKAQRRLLEAIVCQVDEWAHGSDGLGYRVMWRGTFRSGATGVVLRVDRGADVVDFVNTSYARLAHPVVPGERANGPSWLMLEVGGAVWETWAPSGSTVELYDATTDRVIGSGVADARGYVGILPDEPVAPATTTRAVTVFPTGERVDGPFPWTGGDPRECRVLYRTARCESPGSAITTAPRPDPSEGR